MFFTVFKAILDHIDNTISYDGILDGVKIEGNDKQEASLKAAKEFKEEYEKNGYKTEIVGTDDIEDPEEDTYQFGSLDMDKASAVHISTEDGEEDETVLFFAYTSEEIQEYQDDGVSEAKNSWAEEMDIVLEKNVNYYEEELKKAYDRACTLRDYSDESSEDHFLIELLWDSYQDKIDELYGEWKNKKAQMVKEKYDTEASEKLTETEKRYGYNDAHNYYETLYRTSDNRYFIYGYGGALTIYSKEDGDGLLEAGEAYISLTEEQAKRWVLTNAAEDYERIFCSSPDETEAYTDDDWKDILIENLLRDSF